MDIWIKKVIKIKIYEKLIEKHKIKSSVSEVEIMAAARRTDEMGNAHYQTNIRNSKKDKDSAIPKAETRKKHNEENKISNPR
ncbi:MAG: hypothetical protein GX206_05080 [Clostridiales bacterium]|nr:hypothetical protein [Clostridiales bacterium]